MEASVNNLERLVSMLIDSAAGLGLRLLIAVVIYIVGRFVINKITKAMSSMKSLAAVDVTAKTYLVTFTKAVLYVVLVVSIIAELGVPMSSVIAVIASCGVAIGLAMQGALGNIAGGLMLLIFRPFNVGDYIVSGADEGVVTKISIVYTVLKTLDNKMVSIPNGSLMNSNITNATSEPQRRVDLSFNISGESAPDDVIAAIMKPVAKCGKALKDPAPQVVPVCGIPGGLTYAVRVWANTPDYWDVHGELMSTIPVALADAGIDGPSSPVKVSN